MIYSSSEKDDDVLQEAQTQRVKYSDAHAHRRCGRHADSDQNGYGVDYPGIKARSLSWPNLAPQRSLQLLCFGRKTKWWRELNQDQ
ncbi:hypothetical protein KIL84_022707, partial [Mauremys mutica]